MKYDVEMGRDADWWEGFMKYDVEMGRDAMIYVPSFVKIGSDIQRLNREITLTAWWSHKLTFVFKEGK
jgi:hypothetical protein